MLWLKRNFVSTRTLRRRAGQFRKTFSKKIHSKTANAKVCATSNKGALNASLRTKNDTEAFLWANIWLFICAKLLLPSIYYHYKGRCSLFESKNAFRIRFFPSYVCNNIRRFSRNSSTEDQSYKRDWQKVDIRTLFFSVRSIVFFDMINFRCDFVKIEFYLKNYFNAILYRVIYLIRLHKVYLY